MGMVEKSIDVDAPVRTVYNQWTQFEEFPHFMEGVKEVRQLDDQRLHWRAEIAGQEKEWEALITEQTPDQTLAWRSTSGAPNNGTVTFQPLTDNQTRVHLRLEYEPEGAIENIGDAMGMVSSRVEGDLGRFKEFVSSRGQETGAWRGEIHGGQVSSGTGVGSSTTGSMGATGTSGTMGTSSGTSVDRTGTSGT